MNEDTFPQALQLRQKQRELRFPSAVNTLSYNVLPYNYLQTVHELCSSLSWTVHTLLNVSSVLLTECWGHVYSVIQVRLGFLISWRAVCLWRLHICYSQCLYGMNSLSNWICIYYLVHWDFREYQETAKCLIYI